MNLFQALKLGCYFASSFPLLLGSHKLPGLQPTHHEKQLTLAEISTTAEHFSQQQTTERVRAKLTS